MADIAKEILASIDSSNSFTQIFKTNSENKQNQLLFFFKPETFLNGNKASAEKIINFVLEKFKEFKVEISNITQISGEILKKYEVMDRHYGFINTVSKNASQMLSAEDKQKICDMLGIEFNDKLAFFGGHEYLRENRNFDPHSLNKFWLSKKSLKLKSGFYFQKYEIGGKNIVLIDAFHPAQLSHFTDAGRNIVTMSLSSDTDWDILRNDMVGETFPDKAKPSSLRGEIFGKKDEWKLTDVSISNNFCHLSAGPFEAFFEMNNFYGKILEDFNLADTNVFKGLKAQGLSEDEILKALNNPVADGKSLFDATEHSNTSPAIDLYVSKYK